MVGARIALRPCDPGRRQPRRRRRARARRSDGGRHALARRQRPAITTCRWCARRSAGADVVVLEWARRTQGLLLPRRQSAPDPQDRRSRAKAAAHRDAAARTPAVIGCSTIFWRRPAFVPRRSTGCPRAAHAETELAAIIRDGHADVGLGIEAAARANGLAFIPLATERLDLVMLPPRRVRAAAADAARVGTRRGVRGAGEGAGRL